MEYINFVTMFSTLQNAKKANLLDTYYLGQRNVLTDLVTFDLQTFLRLLFKIFEDFLNIAN